MRAATMRNPSFPYEPKRLPGGARATTLEDQMDRVQSDLAEAQIDGRALKAFTDAMSEKLAVKRSEGRGGWHDKDDCSAEFLSRLLRGHVEKGDPVDVANICMMLHQRGERILPPSLAGEVSERQTRVALEMLRHLDEELKHVAPKSDAVTANNLTYWAAQLRAALTPSKTEGGE
jgi:hypothetical protein